MQTPGWLLRRRVLLTGQSTATADQRQQRPTSGSKPAHIKCRAIGILAMTLAWRWKYGLCRQVRRSYQRDEAGWPVSDLHRTRADSGAVPNRLVALYGCPTWRRPARPSRQVRSADLHIGIDFHPCRTRHVGQGHAGASSTLGPTYP